MPRGGLAKMKVSFKSVANKTLGEIFGTSGIPVTQMTKKLWVIIKRYKLLA